MDTLIVFDFDWSLIDCNSDTWVVDKLGASDLMRSLRHILPWTQLMDRMMIELHDRGRTLDDIDRCLQMAPIEPEMESAIKLAAACGCNLQIVSDANSHFIKVILDTNGLHQYFTAIHTNPAHLSNSGALRVFPFHPANELPHGCTLCPPNMCKGSILERIRREAEKVHRKRVIYIGDGGGDYCPSLRLIQGDHVLARLGFPLSKQLQKSGDLVRATVHDWSSARDVEAALNILLQT